VLALQVAGPSCVRTLYSKREWLICQVVSPHYGFKAGALLLIVIPLLYSSFSFFFSRFSFLYYFFVILS
jgi:hypothetical protein